MKVLLSLLPSCHVTCRTFWEAVHIVLWNFPVVSSPGCSTCQVNTVGARRGKAHLEEGGLSSGAGPSAGEACTVFWKGIYQMKFHHDTHLHEGWIRAGR